MQTDSKILVGKIVAPQGLHGEFRIQTFTEQPSDLATMNTGIEFVRVAGPNMAIGKKDGVTNRDGAEKLRGTELFIERTALPDLPTGEHYIADLIGMKYGEHTITDVHNFGAGDILELDDGEMISFAGLTVDYNKKEVK